MNKKLRISAFMLASLMGVGTAFAQFSNTANVRLSTNESTPENPFIIAASGSSTTSNNYFLNANAGVTNGTEIGTRFALFAGEEASAYYLYSITAQKWVSPVSADAPTAGKDKVQLVATKAEAKPFFIKKETDKGGTFDLYPNKAEMDKGGAGLAWNFFSGVTQQGASTVGLYQASDANSSFGFYYNVPEVGKKYSIRVINENGGSVYNQYLYNNNGALGISRNFVKEDKYLYEVVANTDGTYSFQNKAGKFLAFKALADATYNFRIHFKGFTADAVSLWAVAAGKYFVMKFDDNTDQATTLFSPYTTNFSTDFVLEEIADNVDYVTVTMSNEAPVEVVANGANYTSDFSLKVTAGQRPTLSAVSKHPDYEVAGFKHNDSLVTLDAWATYGGTFATGDRIEVVLRPTYFSDSFDNAKWIRIVSSNEATGYSWNASEVAQPYARTTNTTNADELFAFVGTPENFKIYAKSRGASQKLAASATPANGVGTSFTAEGSDWQIVPSPAGARQGVQIAVKGQTGVVVNKFGGSGEKPLKFYAAGDNGGIWKISAVSPVNISTAMLAEAPMTPAPSARVDVNGVSIGLPFTLGNSAATTHYLPKKGAVLQLVNDFRGYLLTAQLDGVAKRTGDSLNFVSDNTLLSVSATVDPSNKHQYLFYRDNTASYRIPAITTTNDGRVVAATDHRIDHADIGQNKARVNIKVRRGAEAGLTWNGTTWEDPVMAAQGTGVADDGNNNVWNYAFGDPALVADRDSSHVLLITVGGSKLFWDSTPTSPQHVVRHFSADNGKTWTHTNITNLTGQFYSVTEDPTKVLLGKAGGAFFGSGRIVQSKVYKKDNYYRLYACLLGQTNRARTGNFVTYSDDFGATWHPLGIANLNALDGDEPKVEELPDGTIMLSSRRGGSRTLNLFKWDTTNPNAMAEGKGTWGSALYSNSNGDRSLSFGGNATNGEVLVVRGVKKADGTTTDLLLQSIPFANDRSNVGFFYKELNKAGKDMSVADLCTGWTRGLQVSDRGSAYSTMTMLPDGKVGFFYEEDPTGYAMVYVPLTIAEITNNAYTSGFEPYTITIEGDKADSLGVAYLGAHYAGVANAKNGGTLYLSKVPTVADFKLTGSVAARVSDIHFVVEGRTIRVSYDLTAIHSTTTNATAKGEVYDLQGRRHQEAKASGIYIVDGKKVKVRR